MKDKSAAAQLWNPDQASSPFAPISPQLPAFPDADAILYTDGSAADGEQGQSIGSGVFCQKDNLQLTVDPCGMSATNTITRAELAAICAALQHRSSADCTIATDSLASMFSIGNARKDPCRCTESPHMLLLRKIADMLLMRSNDGLSTCIIKVKSHVGIAGNKAADKSANAARDPSICQVHISDGNHAFEHRK